MKNVIALMALVLLAGTIGCSSTPKQEEAPEAQAQAQVDPLLEEQTNPQVEPTLPPPAVEDTSSSTTSSSDLSLGAGSSGRGH